MKLPQNWDKASITSRLDTLHGGLGGFDLLQLIKTQDANQHTE